MKISILGATGSIGMQTLDVVRTCLPHAKIAALSGFSNIEKLSPLVEEFKPNMVWVPDDASASVIAGLTRNHPEILTGEDGLISIAAESDAEILVNALVGRAGLAPTLAAINAGKNIALANKETLVTAGELVMRLAREKKIKITPIDSEHSAIWQCLNGGTISEVEKIILTASGGPFLGWTRDKISAAKASDALKHPNWSMGAKITIDSATLMNKGLELIEAMWLFNQPMQSIEILVHPQSIIHSMVQFIDGSVMAQAGLPDMRLPILYALSAPSRIKTDFPRVNFLEKNNITFETPVIENFPCLSLAQHAAKIGGTLPAVMNYLNEWAVGQFLQDKIGFYQISDIISDAFGIYNVKPVISLNDITEAEDWAVNFIGGKKWQQ
ncbi:MAG: 1-deoxy-D-xylulose-5-phosphate reductoisomerase [Clostridiales bacterium]|jgi:1-deoxy-D-xylulose-5-phosphate reductoisomerase|nr:1-deoxy-D-xylulose-5-phosphate reductoisomerase [Clostridiales bacterium]